MTGDAMDDEGRRKATMSDAEWAEFVRSLELSTPLRAKLRPRVRLSARRSRAGRRMRPLRRQRIITIAAATIVAAGLVAAAVLSAQHGRPRAGAASGPRAAARPFADTPAAHWAPAAQALRMPPARRLGPYAAATVGAALARARAYWLAARASDAVLVRHNLALVQRLASRRALGRHASLQERREQLGVTVLAPGNRLVAPVRLAGTVTATYVPQHGRAAAHLAVRSNVVWAYALAADYAIAPIPYHVVALRERAELSFYLDPAMDGVRAKPVLDRSRVLWFDTDCGYFNDVLLGLPRRDDPDALPNTRSVNSRDAFDPTRPFPAASHQCRPVRR